MSLPYGHVVLVSGYLVVTVVSDHEMDLPILSTGKDVLCLVHSWTLDGAVPNVALAWGLRCVLG